MVAAFGDDDLVDEAGRALFACGAQTELPQEIAIGFTDPLADFRATEASARRLVTGSGRSIRSATGAAISHAVARGLADAMLLDLWAGRETAAFALPRAAQAVEPGDILRRYRSWRVLQTLMVSEFEEMARHGGSRRGASTLRSFRRRRTRRACFRLRRTAPASPPEVLFLDLPLLTDVEPPFAPRVAAFARPWPGAVAIALGTTRRVSFRGRRSSRPP